MVSPPVPQRPGDAGGQVEEDRLRLKRVDHVPGLADHEGRAQAVGIGERQVGLLKLVECLHHRVDEQPPLVAVEGGRHAYRRAWIVQDSLQSSTLFERRIGPK